MYVYVCCSLLCDSELQGICDMTLQLLQRMVCRNLTCTVSSRKHDSLAEERVPSTALIPGWELMVSARRAFEFPHIQSPHKSSISVSKCVVSGGTFPMHTPLSTRSDTRGSRPSRPSPFSMFI